MSTPPTLTLTDWEKQLYPLLLPINPEVKQQVLNHINSNNASAKNIAAIIQQDPVLCLLLFHHANQSLSVSGNESYELAHAISLLGFSRVETLVSNSIEYNNNTPHLSHYRQQLSISIHAAYQADGWSHKQPHWAQGTLYWAALFNYSPLWALWHHAGDKMAQWQQIRRQRSGATHSCLEQSIFGMPLSVLCTSLSKKWHLPHLSQQSWLHRQYAITKHWITLSQQNAIITPALQTICHSPSFAITLANRLAEEAEWNWQSQRSLRLQRILANSLQCSIDQAVCLTHQLAVKACDQQAALNALPCAIQLLSYHQKEACYHQAKPLPELTLTTSTNAQEETITTPNINTINLPSENKFEQTITRLTEQPTAFADVHEVMNLATILLTQHTGLDRVTISLLNLQNKEIRTIYSAGCSNAPALKNFSHTLQRGDLFNKLLQKPGSLRVGENNHSKIWPLLPKKFQQASNAKEFFMMSLFANKKPIAVLYVDNANGRTLLNDQQYKCFKQLSQAMCQYLATLYNKQKSKKTE